MPSPPLICLITPGHVASTPRLVKNADALAEAGYRVHVVAAAPYPPNAALDADLLARAAWIYTSLGSPTFARRVVRKLSHVAARRVVLLRPPGLVTWAQRAQNALGPSLSAAAARVPAQLYIGHCLAGLPAAADAARRSGAHLAFDLEDYHDAETFEAIGSPVERSVRRTLQAALLPRCRALFASSPLIANKYTESYGVKPQTLLNVFPLSHAPHAPLRAEPPSEGRPAIFYWFSQTIGPGRGIERVIEIAGRMRTPVELQFRGYLFPGYADRLQTLAQRSGLRRRIAFLEPGPPSEMARLASHADLGLSIEESEPLNRDLCLTNKVFTYLTAGIPQLLSETAAQRSLAPALGDAALLADVARTESTASLLDLFFADTPRVQRGRDAAWSLARSRFCWEVEKKILLDAVQSMVPLAP